MLGENIVNIGATPEYFIEKISFPLLNPLQILGLSGFFGLQNAKKNRDNVPTLRFPILFKALHSTTLRKSHLGHIFQIYFNFKLG